MGFNTTVVILNDGLHDIKKDKDFGKKLYDAISDFQGRPITLYSGHGNVGAVIETHHASHDVLISVGGNTGEIIDPLFIKKLTKNKTDKAQKEVKNVE